MERNILLLFGSEPSFLMNVKVRWLIERTCGVGREREKESERESEREGERERERE